MQWWCSPQSSVPRQTVGHHARAATYEMGLNNPRRLPCGGAQCEPDDPPTGPFHIPTDRRAGRGTPLRADARAVGFRKTHFVWVSLKIDSRTYKTRPDWPAASRTEETKNDQVRTAADAGRRAAISQPRSFFSFPPPALLFLPSPRIPTDRRAGRGTPPRADSRAAGFRETHSARVSLKIDSRPRKTAPGAGCRREANPRGRGRGRATPSRRKVPAPHAYPGPTLYLPCTYPAPTLHRTLGERRASTRRVWGARRGASGRAGGRGER